ncbi:glycosyltransferase family 25 protein [Acinetobacter baumannii]|uniref:glycosyltransferase family 25 protein n=1 Tax=Acinetobacter baumannii TaxID=470 RepID=UPI000DE6A1D4|nr:glycosyltransferase family 25 protein [Acinetobacter baumannii]MBJ9579613.1 glycosyltransferase family 25 protein [Acinetobacter baumannii]MCX2994846.1 glycosyltransferase family 25 protein [Acinetobacter baumannii]MDC4403272.1 glycosyltransferase family 25 protein [Acinetobacter baumannii]MDC4532015.1 glycosyltransferase family 25 protein [Acinetobacter baumannii]MDC4780362.1 glycosyltransferase family 25 protein [Acinetobacter baumannii]
MQIYIVSIEDESSPRLVKFLSQNFFKSSDVNYKKIGIKGIDLPTKQYFEQAVKGRIKPLTPGELGCTLSHLKALELFLESEDEYALIFEDDAILPDDLTIDKLKQELEKISLPPNLLFSLGGIQMKECLKTRGEFKDYNFLNKKVLEVVPDFFHRACYAFAYVVDRKMAETLLKYHHKIRKADDWSYLFDFDSTVHILMSFIIDHPVIEIGEKDPILSRLESERAKTEDLEKSKYGHGLRKNLAKVLHTTYFKE